MFLLMQVLVKLVDSILEVHGELVMLLVMQVMAFCVTKEGITHTCNAAEILACHNC